MGRKKVLFDINIVIDFIDATRENNQIVKKLIHKLILDDYKIVITEDMLSTVFYIQKDKKTTLQFLKTIQEDWLIVGFGQDVIRNAIKLSLERNLGLEDLLQCLCAKENGCEALITNDNKFYDCGMNIYTIEKFLAK